MNRLINLVVFVEFAPLESVLGSGSTITPADARYSLTIGSVNGDGLLADYSSRGLQNENRTKPDLSAPGELLLNGDKPFIGTSAAAPVVAGVAALLWQENPAYTADQLYNAIKERWISPRDLLSYGTGIIRLTPPPRSRITITNQSIAAKTVFPQPGEEDVPLEGFACPGAVPIRLDQDLFGYVNYNLGLAMRGEPRNNAQELTRLFLGERFTVVGGPECNAPFTWWQIELDDGSQGWVAEGAEYYLIAPISFEQAVLPVEYDTDCSAAAAPQLEIGERAEITNAPPGGVSFYRSTGGENLIAGVGEGVRVHVLGGPICEGQNNNVLRWYVRVLDGEWAGNEGWMAESTTGTRFMEPE